MNEEILSGLKGALERGFKLEDSVQSFINAGYNPAEVREAEALLSRGFSPLPSSTKEEAAMKEEAPKQKMSSRMKWILVILAALIALGIAIAFLLFRNQLLGLVIDPYFP